MGMVLSTFSRLVRRLTEFCSSMMIGSYAFMISLLVFDGYDGVIDWLIVVLG